MPPPFVALPERQMMLPLMGPLPVISQMRAINCLNKNKVGDTIICGDGCKTNLRIFQRAGKIKLASRKDSFVL
jgi:hypothetical protein